MKVYIAGKINGDPDYREKFDHAAKVLRSVGDIPLNPAVLPDGLGPADCMRICLAMLDTADAILLLPDHNSSRGASIELSLAHYEGKLVLYMEPGDMIDIHDE